jgi:hypothetical protein
MSSSKLAGRAAVVFGVLAALAIPAAIVAAQVLAGVTLLHALYIATPISVALGLLALLLARRARLAAARTLAGGGPVRMGRIAAWLGLYVGVSAAIALGVYGVLVGAK